MRLLFPEWLNWGERYHGLDAINQWVWEQTRGVARDYRDKWQRDIHAAVIDGLVSDNERSLALQRYSQWMIHLPKPAD
jgi:hypothetical protein